MDNFIRGFLFEHGVQMEWPLECPRGPRDPAERTHDDNHNFYVDVTA